MSDIVLPENLGNTIRVDGVCYEFVEMTAETPDITYADAYDNCAECGHLVRRCNAIAA